MNSKSPHKLTREEIEEMSLSKNDKNTALMMFDSGADVLLAEEGEHGFTLLYVFSNDV